MRKIKQGFFFFLVLAVSGFSFFSADKGYASVSPSSFVQSYCESDGVGAGLSSKTNRFVFKLTTWKDAPGWDTYTVVKRYRVGSAKIEGDHATVHVTYRVLGTVSNDITPGKNDEEVDFSLVRLDSKWKIESPQLMPHVLLSVALHREKKHPQYSKLKQWGGQ